MEPIETDPVIPAEVIDASGNLEASEASEPNAAKWGPKGRQFWKEWIKPLLIIGLVMFSFRSAVADWNDVPTGSMKPTILEGDRIFINKVAYDLKFPFTRFRLARWDLPEWGDVVVLRSPEDGRRLVKRVVGLPGDLLEIRGYHLYRNSEKAEYSALEPWIVDQIDKEEQPGYFFEAEEMEGRKHPIMTSIRTVSRMRGRRQPFQVPADHYFVMGDNRGNSKDSRYFGYVHRQEILGRATAVALSFDRESYYKPRWDRFFSKLP